MGIGEAVNSIRRGSNWPVAVQSSRISSDTFLPSLTPQSSLAELPTWDVRLPASANGSELDTVLRADPNLPGVVVADRAEVLGAISRSHFQQVISRPFGGEIIRPRAIGSLLHELSSGDLVIFDAGMPIQEALRQSLMRDKSMIYEPVLVSVDDEVRLIGFTDLLRADSRISGLRNLQMQEILDTVQEGFLLVERNHRVAAQYSRSVETILGLTGLAGWTLPELLGGLIGANEADLAHGYLETLFNPNVIEKLVAGINPLVSVQVRERDGRPRQHLSFAFRRSTEGGQI
ncbi:MAG: hypothetical protein ACRD3J_17955, partial [Thermoanaerobaculia bacterium]